MDVTMHLLDKERFCWIRKDYSGCDNDCWIRNDYSEQMHLM